MFSYPICTKCDKIRASIFSKTTVSCKNIMEVGKMFHKKKNGLKELATLAPLAEQPSNKEAYAIYKRLEKGRKQFNTLSSDGLSAARSLVFSTTIIVL